MTLPRSVTLAGFAKKFGVLIAGISMLVVGNVIQEAYDPIRDLMQECTGNTLPPGWSSLPPSTSITSTCLYETDIGQDLFFWADTTIEGQSVPIPTKVQIRGPDGQLLKEEQFDSAWVVVQVRPTAFGTYTATITSLEEESDPRAPLSGDRSTKYAFGHLFYSYFKGVTNPAGDAVNNLLFTAGILNFVGALMVIMYVTKSVYMAVSRSLQRKKSDGSAKFSYAAFVVFLLLLAYAHPIQAFALPCYFGNDYCSGVDFLPFLIVGLPIAVGVIILVWKKVLAR
jgi:hypothetical protein